MRFSSPIRSPMLFMLVVVLLLISWNFATGNQIANPFSPSPPDFENWTIDSDFTEIQDSQGQIWKIRYEARSYATFSGSVRHASPINERMFPLISHDILVTSGDFADPDRVRTSVSNHRFVWYAFGQETQDGGINLLHTVPVSMETYDQLRQVRKGQSVSISGWEILDIRVYDSEGRPHNIWSDSGCNTLLVDLVVIEP
jgi:hypothetical protein